MVRHTFIVLVAAIVAVQGLLATRLADDAATPPSVLVIVAPPAFPLPAALQSAAEQAGLKNDASWSNASRLLCALLEKNGVTAASVSADEVEARLQGLEQAPAGTHDRAAWVCIEPLRAQARAMRDDITRSQARAVEREQALVAISEQIRPFSEVEGPPRGDDTAWRRLRERLRSAP